MTAAAVQPTAQPIAEWRNLFGVCACLGEDFGFNPLWLRIAFGAALILAPVAVIASYFALGVLVLASRLLFPRVKRGAKVAVLPRREEAAVAEPELRLAA